MIEYCTALLIHDPSLQVCDASKDEKCTNARLKKNPLLLIITKNFYHPRKIATGSDFAAFNDGMKPAMNVVTTPNTTANT